MEPSFIPLGFHCNVTYLSQDTHMKRETSLFEWFQSEKLQYITDIVNTIKNKIDTNIFKKFLDHICLFHKHVYTYHYTLKEYEPIFIRRATRFLDMCKNSNKLVFIRINPVNIYTTEEEIHNFCEEIHTINPSLRITFLMIHTVDTLTNYKYLDESKIPNSTLIQREFMSSDCPDQYLRDNIKLQELFLQYLQDCGIDTNTKYNASFTDKS
jgi:hypothetical protein